MRLFKPSCGEERLWFLIPGAVGGTRVSKPYQGMPSYPCTASPSSSVAKSFFLSDSAPVVSHRAVFTRRTWVLTLRPVVEYNGDICFDGGH